jgi:hypothetical protein
MIAENGWERVRPALVPSVVLFALLIALIRYPDPVTWSSASAWIFLVMLAGALVLGGMGWLLAKRARVA